MTLDQHLAWMVELLKENRNAWRDYCWDKAQALARDRPELAELPALLTQAMQTASKTSGKSQPSTGERNEI